ncbi:acyltransferase family protein [Paenibacillus thailandensis]|uniref:Acyltransferase family protein n=1 Tax=Paenibacillus thailandensis TaxID=393250 RepID=A0ABW5QTD1_9BACL
MSKREIWIDVAKGLGIIAVVLGHSNPDSTVSHYIYWFHMPLFFFLSGYTFKTISSGQELLGWVKRRSKQLLIPYLSFGLVITVLEFAKELKNGHLDMNILLKDLGNLIYGGQMLTGGYAVFWFVTCLLITQVVFAVLTTLVKGVPFQIAIIIALYLLAHIETTVYPNANIPLNADVTMLAMTYYAAGYYTKPLLQKLFESKFILLFALIIPALLFSGDYFKLFHYSLDMKVLEYTSWVMDLIIPITMTLAFSIICYWIARAKSIAKVFSYIGLMSLTIMYMHFPINLIAEEVIGKHGAIQFLLLGCIVPAIIHSVLDKITLAKVLFLGSGNKKAYAA